MTVQAFRRKLRTPFLPPRRSVQPQAEPELEHASSRALQMRTKERSASKANRAMARVSGYGCLLHLQTLLEIGQVVNDDTIQRGLKGKSTASVSVPTTAVDSQALNTVGTNGQRQREPTSSGCLLTSRGSGTYNGPNWIRTSNQPVMSRALCR